MPCLGPEEKRGTKMKQKLPGMQPYSRAPRTWVLLDLERKRCQGVPTRRQVEWCEPVDHLRVLLWLRTVETLCWQTRAGRPLRSVVEEECEHGWCG